MIKDMQHDRARVCVNGEPGENRSQFIILVFVFAMTNWALQSKL